MNVPSNTDLEPEKDCAAKSPTNSENDLVKARSKETPFTCTYCGWPCVDRQSLIVHGQFCNNSSKDKGNAVDLMRRGVCPDCKFYFRYDELIQHRQSFCIWRSKEKNEPTISDELKEGEKKVLKTRTHTPIKRKKIVKDPPPNHALYRIGLKTYTAKRKNILKDGFSTGPEVAKPPQTNHENSIDYEEHHSKELLTAPIEKKGIPKPKINYTCEYCWARFEFLNRYMVHQHYCLLGPSKNPILREPTRLQVCRYCNFTFSDKRVLAQHLQAYCPGKSKDKLAETNGVGEIPTAESKDEKSGHDMLEALKYDNMLEELEVKNEPIEDDDSGTVIESTISIKKEPGEDMELEKLDLQCEIKIEGYTT